MLTARGAASAQTAADDSIEVGLLTCKPGQQVYSLYGHTAIRFHDLRTGEDWAFNYGVFNFRKPHFILRFVFGLTDYELGVVPMDIFCREYTRDGRGVTEQVLNMTTGEKLALREALAENYMPENRVYRYNYFYDNCTTRARDMLERCWGGRLSYGDAASRAAGERLTWREMIHALNGAHPWAAEGNDLCLGVGADRNADWRQRQFLPERLEQDMARATVTDEEGHTEPAVLQTRVIVPDTLQTAEKEFPLSPTGCALVLASVVLLITVAEWRTGRWLRAVDVVLMLVQGIAGIVIGALFFSEHPTTSTNLQILLLNPLALGFVWQVARGKRTWWWKINGALLILFLLCGFLQSYAEGMVIVALSLLLRSVAGELRQRRTKKQSAAASGQAPQQ